MTLADRVPLRVRRSVTGWLAAAIGLFSARPVLADDGAPSPPIVRVFVAGSAEAVAGSRDAVQDLCAHANVAVIVRDAAGADEELLSTSHPPGLAEAYIDLRSGMPARVVVVDSETRENLERRTLPEGGSLEMSIETAAHVVCTAVESAISARSARAAAALAAPAKPPEPAEPSPPKESRGGGVESRVSAFGVASNFGFGFLGGGGAAFGLRFGDSKVGFGGMLPLFGYARSEVEHAGGEMPFLALSARLVPTIDWQATRIVGFFAGVGAGVDWVQVEPEVPPTGTVPGSSQAMVEAIGSALIGATANITQRAGALLTLGLELNLTPHRYVIESPEGVSTFFESSRVRPIAMLGAYFSFGGPDRPDGAAEPEKRQ